MAAIHLPDVTLIAVDSACRALTYRAIEDSASRVRFGNIITFCDYQLGPWHNVQYDGKGARAAEWAIWNVVPRHVTTSHFLWVQWDSWVTHPEEWTDEFLQYDYIGAPWWHLDGRNVGNGGFSLRSTALMNYLTDNLTTLPFDQPEDDILCRKYRPLLEREGFTWAPLELAYQFSYERTRLANRERSFGFHGMFNWPRELTRSQVDDRMMHAPEYVLKHGHYKEMRANLALAA